MLSRVQRQEQQRFEQRVQKRKVKLKKDISDIDQYLASVKDREDFFASLPSVKNDVLLRVPAAISSAPTILPVAPAILPAPGIVFGERPMLRQTRMHRYKQRWR